MPCMSDVDKARKLADEIRPIWPEKAAEIDKAIKDLASGKRDGLKIDIGMRCKLEKFDGEFSPGMVPTEIIETNENL